MKVEVYFNINTNQKTKIMKIKFKKWTGELKVTRYAHGNRIALLIVDSEGPIAYCTVNIPEEPMAEDEVAIKDYSENEGMLETLMEAKVVSMPVRHIRTGHVIVPVCKLLINVEDYL